jgi:hypothetical protein
VPLYDDDGNELTAEQAMQYLQAQQEPQQQQGRPFVRDLETRLNKAQTEARDAADRAAAAERRLAFVEAGVPLMNADGTPNPLASYFVNGYQGEVTPDAIRAEATSLGLLSQQAPVPQAQPPQQQVFGQMAEATQGQVTPGQRNYDAEIAAAGQARDKPLMHRLVNEKAQAEGRTTPGVVYD